MRQLQRAIMATAILLTGCIDHPISKMENSPTFPIVRHILWPTYGVENGQIANGLVTGSARALEQPIKFPHYTHATTLGMNCEYCHADARKSIHAGVPSTQVCMNCHQYVKTDRPEIKKLKAFYDSGEPIAWNKVHDLPDFVNFAHSRHVRAGVQCTECHGQIELQGEPVTFMKKVEPAADAPPGTEATEQEVFEPKTVMVRETTLQMGWCIDCHTSHPSIDQNYGDQAQTRRAELKDCWTCHK